MKTFLPPPGKNFAAVAHAYATVIFCANPWIGLLLLAASMYYPWSGLTGLAGTIIALVCARIMRFERAAVDDGRLLFNSLLCSLALGYWAPPGALVPWFFAGLLIFVAVVALGCTVVLNQMTLVLVGTPSRSLAYCVVGIGLHWLLMILMPVASATNLTPLFATPHFSLPLALDLWARSLGTIYFVPVPEAGLLILLALALASRLSLLHALLGFGVSAGVLWACGFNLAESSWLQLDAMLCAVALGGVFYIPSRASLLLAAGGAALCTVIGIALLHGLYLIDAPLLTLPLNMVVLGTAGALRWRMAGSEPRAALLPGKSPEATLRADRLWRARHPDATLPAIAAPFDGVWVVTQGFDDQLTHRGAWQHALDFEVADAAGKPARPESGALEDFPSFNAPIISSVDGRVARVVDDIADNPIGETNLLENWGNSIVVEIAPQLYVQLSHLRHRGCKVREGDRVRQGQLLGYLGNSGRSPVPHLHVQMQTQPDVGAPTIPFRLRGYRIPNGKSQDAYRFRGLPESGASIAGCRRARWMEECFGRREEFSRRYAVFTARGESSETIRYSPQPGGLLSLHSVEADARLTLVVNEDHVTPVNFEGSRRSLLAAVWMAGRVPLVAMPGLQWADPVDPASESSMWLRLWRDLTAPWFPHPLESRQARLVSSRAAGKYFAVHWTTPHRADIELQFSADTCLAAGRLETNHGWLRFHAVETAPPTSLRLADLPDSKPELARV